MPSTLLMPRRTLLRAGALGALGLSLMGSAGCSSRSSGSNYIAIITPAHDNPFFKTQAEAAVAAATAMGYTANSFSHGDDVNKQSELFDSAISQGAAAIICDNAGADSTEGAVRKAVEVGIPVFLIDREINASGLATAQIVANNSQGAALVAAKLADTLQGKGRYYELLGRETDTNAQVRSTAFHSVLDQYPGFELVATETANWDQQIGYQKVETLLQRDANVQAIICGNDTMAVGAVAAVQQAGKTGDILVIGFDGSPDAVKAIQGGLDAGHGHAAGGRHRQDGRRAGGRLHQERRDRQEGEAARRLRPHRQVQCGPLHAVRDEGVLRPPGPGGPNRTGPGPGGQSRLSTGGWAAGSPRRARAGAEPC